MKVIAVVQLVFGLGLMALGVAQIHAAYVAAGDGTTDVVTRLEMHPGETLRLAHPIGAMDVVCR